MAVAPRRREHRLALAMCGALQSPAHALAVARTHRAAVAEFFIAMGPTESSRASMNADRRTGGTRVHTGVHAGDSVVDRTALTACERGEHAGGDRCSSTDEARGPGA